MNLFFTVYIAVILYITIPIVKIIWEDKCDNDMLFLLFSNYILIFLLSLIFDYHNNLFYSIMVALILMVASFLLVRKIKAAYNRYQILSIPYFIFVVFTFSNILVLI